MTALSHTHTHTRREFQFFLPPTHPSAFMLPSPAEEALSIQFPIFVRPFFTEGHSAAPAASPTIAASTFLKWLQITPCASAEAWRSPEEQHEVGAIALSFPQKKNDDGCKKHSAGDKMKKKRKTHAIKLLNSVIAALMPRTHKINTLQSNQNALSWVQSAPRADVS